MARQRFLIVAPTESGAQALKRAFAETRRGNPTLIAVVGANEQGVCAAIGQQTGDFHGIVIARRLLTCAEAVRELSGTSVYSHQAPTAADESLRFYEVTE